ncbi:MAG TPA: dihydrofolate reductase family protein [Thermoplasmata archaeon]|nr:dihydrofolate reductase family protein [Thermoplasmata archaeon]
MATAAPPADRPTVWVNCAVSMDGRLAFSGGARARLSSPEDLVRVQRIRAQVDGIVVGVGTVILDDPSLRVHWELLGASGDHVPTRIVLDGSGRIPDRARVLDGSAPTIVATTERSHRVYPPPTRTLVVGQSSVDLPVLFARLRALGLRSLLVEGGSAVLASVLRTGLFDRLTVYYAPVAIGGVGAPTLLSGRECYGARDAVALTLTQVERAGEGLVASFVPRRSPAP